MHERLVSQILRAVMIRPRLCSRVSSECSKASLLRFKCRRQCFVHLLAAITAGPVRLLCSISLDGWVLLVKLFGPFGWLSQHELELVLRLELLS